MIQDSYFYDDYEPYDYEPDPIEKQLCTNCEKLVEPYFVDEGIGDYEYWGCEGRDIQLVPYCPQCDCELEG